MTDPFPAEVVAAARAAKRIWPAIPSAISLAQWAVESAYGTRMPAGSNNPFGIKAVAGQASVSAMTREVFHGTTVHLAQPFAVFRSLDEAFEAHARLLATSPHYASARAKLPDADGFAQALTGVYATDPHYGATLIGVMRVHDLYRFDREAAAATPPAALPAAHPAPQSPGLSPVATPAPGFWSRLVRSLLTKAA